MFWLKCQITFVGKLSSLDVEIWIGVEIDVGVIVAMAPDVLIEIGVFDVIV